MQHDATDVGVAASGFGGLQQLSLGLWGFSGEFETVTAERLELAPIPLLPVCSCNHIVLAVPGTSLYGAALDTRLVTIVMQLSIDSAAHCECIQLLIMCFVFGYFYYVGAVSQMYTLVSPGAG